MFRCIVVIASAFIFVIGSSISAAAQGPSDEERDFLPGEKAVFYDDYTDMAKGAAPPH
jgi:hypothetical protein